jgi:hypothetical protein
MELEPDGEEEEEDEDPTHITAPHQARRRGPAASARRKEVATAADSDEEDALALVPTEPFEDVGISFRATFPSDIEAQSIEQLSGGQKTMAAVALIIAIQRTDPAPFYLFDEIDAALDARYRQSFATMIKRMSQAPTQTQFIISSFRPEIVLQADRCYKVEYRFRTSTITPVDTDEALQFVTPEDHTAPPASQADPDADPDEASDDDHRKAARDGRAGLRGKKSSGK